MNKKGDSIVAIYVFLVVVIILFVLTMISFLSFNEKFDDSFRGQRNLVVGANHLEEYLSKVSESYMKEAIMKGGDLKENFKTVTRNNEIITSSTNYYSSIRNDRFSISEISQNYVLEIDNLFVKIEDEHGSIIRNFNLKITFDKTGNILKIESKNSLNDLKGLQVKEQADTESVALNV